MCLLNELQKQLFFLKGIVLYFKLFLIKLKLCIVLLNRKCITGLFVMSHLLQIKSDIASIVQK